VGRPGILDRVIDAYLTELRGSLHGPRRVRADLLTEVRDGLVDATAAYQRKGLCRQDAERAAVREFGAVDAVAPEFQAELAVAQARRTALLVLGLIAVESTVTGLAWKVAARGVDWQPNAAYGAVANAVDIAGYASALVGAALALLASGVGARWLPVGARFTRATGVFALGVYGFFVVASTVLTAFSPIARAMFADGTGVLLAAVCWVLPLAMVVSGRRCLRAAA
jgi:hypothetical protein